MESRVDFLVIGSGIAGLTYALKVADHFPDNKLLVLTKDNEDESNTKYAQGGVAAVVDFEKDSFQKHIEDTLDAGDGLCNRDVVEFCVKEAPERINEIIGWGTRFDQTSSGNFDLGKEGGHTANRVLHHKDVTGREIERALLQKIHAAKNIDLITHHFVIDLITQHHFGHLVTRVTPDITCYGVYVLNTLTNKIEKILSKITFLATGGVGQVYRNTTNPLIATGDGIAMVYRAKGRIENMEFIQFHPTALFNPDETPSFLVTEAARGHGGILKTKDGRQFMERYDERKSLAPRDIVARAIDNELKVSGEDHVYLDVSHLNDFDKKFPNIHSKCLSLGIDPEKDMIPVVPAAHYSCGGIKIDHYGRTSIKNLYACGECSSSGLHGANRLASNSLLEALVFSQRIYLDSVDEIGHIQFQENIPDWNAEGTTEPKEMVLITQSRKELQEIMSYYVGIVRSDVRLKRAADRLELLYNESEDLYNTTILSPQLCELRNMITVGYLITRSSAMRHESRGLHYTTDYPKRKTFIENTIL